MCVMQCVLNVFPRVASDVRGRVRPKCENCICISGRESNAESSTYVYSIDILMYDHGLIDCFKVFVGSFRGNN